MAHYKQLELDYNAPEMGETSFREDDYIVLSLYPESYERILSSENTYEYRIQFRKRPTIAFVYLMSPVKCTSGIIRFDTPLIDSPEEEEQKPGNCKPVIEYLSRYKLGYAIPNRKVTEITPVSLASLQSKHNFTPPQAFLYLKNNRPLFDFLVIQSNLETLIAGEILSQILPH